MRGLGLVACTATLAVAGAAQRAAAAVGLRGRGAGRGGCGVVLRGRGASQLQPRHPLPPARGRGCGAAHPLRPARRRICACPTRASVAGSAARITFTVRLDRAVRSGRLALTLPRRWTQR